MLIVDNDQHRNQWRTAIVEEVIRGEDELTRRVKVRVANKHLDRKGKEMCPPTILERPIQKLVLLLPREEN